MLCTLSNSDWPYFRPFRKIVPHQPGIDLHQEYSRYSNRLTVDYPDGASPTASAVAYFERGRDYRILG